MDVEQVTETETPDMRGISRCWQYLGYHVYMAGPCFEKLDSALRYRKSLDDEGVTWRPQRR